MAFLEPLRRMIRDDPNPVTDAMRARARELAWKAMRLQLPLIRDHFQRDFHPWQCRDEVHLAAWYASPEAAGGRGI